MAVRVITRLVHLCDCFTGEPLNVTRHRSSLVPTHVPTNIRRILQESTGLVYIMDALKWPSDKGVDGLPQNLLETIEADTLSANEPNTTMSRHGGPVIR